MNKESTLFFSQENPWKIVWKIIGKLDFLGNQTPQNRRGEEKATVVSLSSYNIGSKFWVFQMKEPLDPMDEVS